MTKREEEQTPEGEEEQAPKRTRVQQAIQAPAYFEVDAAIANVVTRINNARGGVGPKIRRGVIVEAFLAYCVTRSVGEQNRMFEEGREIIRRKIESTDKPGEPLNPDDAIHRTVTGGVQPGGSSTVIDPGKKKDRKRRRDNHEMHA